MRRDPVRPAHEIAGDRRPRTTEPGPWAAHRPGQDLRPQGFVAALPVGAHRVQEQGAVYHEAAVPEAHDGITEAPIEDPHHPGGPVPGHGQRNAPELVVDDLVHVEHRDGVRAGGALDDDPDHEIVGDERDAAGAFAGRVDLLDAQHHGIIQPRHRVAVDRRGHERARLHRESVEIETVGGHVLPVARGRVGQSQQGGRQGPGEEHDAQEQCQQHHPPTLAEPRPRAARPSRSGRRADHGQSVPRSITRAPGGSGWTWMSTIGFRSRTSSASSRGR